MITAFRLILLLGLIICAIATALTKNLMRSVIVYTVYGILMSVVWLLLSASAIQYWYVQATFLVVVQCRLCRTRRLCATTSRRL